MIHTIKSTILLISIFVSTSLLGQTTKDGQADKIFSDVVGKWTLKSLHDGKKEITPQDSAKLQRLEFAEDGRYVIFSGINAIDSGSYRANENQQSLYMQSDLDKDNPVEWKVMMNTKSVMTLSQKGEAHAQRYRYVYVKQKAKIAASSKD